MSRWWTLSLESCEGLEVEIQRGRTGIGKLIYALHKLRESLCEYSLYHDILNDSPQPHCSVIFGFRKMNLALSLSSNQSISLPMILNNALESIKTLTPSCSTLSSNGPGLSTYSRWYASPEHPRFLTPIRISLLSGCSKSFLSCSTALGVRFIAALRGRSLLFLGAAGFVGEGDGGATLVRDSSRFCSCGAAAVDLLFCASPSRSP